MKRPIIASASVALLGSLGFSTAAYATAPVVAPLTSAPSAPDACSGRIDARQFNTGFNIGARTVQSAVARVSDCDQIDQVSDFIIDTVDRLTPPPGANSRTTCRFAGILDGVLTELDNQNFACEESCTADGADFGKLSGEFYCELSLLTGGLGLPNALERRPVNTCGFFYEITCDSEFISTTQSFSDPVFGECSEYTLPPFTEVWIQSRANQCAYDPEVGPQVRN